MDDIFALKAYQKTKELEADLSAYKLDYAYQVNQAAEMFGVHWDKFETPTLTRLNASRGATVNIAVDNAMVLNEFDTSSLFVDWKEVTDSLGNVFIRIPKTYIKKVDKTNYKAWYASRRKFEGAYLPYCFWDFANSKELDYIDVGKYPANLGAENKLESKSGTYPLVNTNIVNMRTYANNNNTGGLAGYQQLDIHVVDLLQTLFIIEQATLHSQSKIAGYTAGQYTSTHLAVVAENNTNRIIVPNATASLYEVGQAISVGTSQGGNQIFYGRTITSIEIYDASNKAIVFDGTPVNIAIGNYLYNTGYKNGFSSNIVSSVGSIYSNTSGKHPFVWHGIESLYGNVWQFVDGININELQSWVCKDASKYASNLFTSPYEQLSYVNASANGYVKIMGYDANLPFANFPTDATGADGKYYSDYYYQNTGQSIALVGGYWYGGADAGLFYWLLRDSSSYARARIGGRLLKKPL